MNESISVCILHKGYCHLFFHENPVSLYFYVPAPLFSFSRYKWIAMGPTPKSLNCYFKYNFDSFFSSLDSLLNFLPAIFKYL